LKQPQREGQKAGVGLYLPLLIPALASCPKFLCSCPISMKRVKYPLGHELSAARLPGSQFQQLKRSNAAQICRSVRDQ